MKPYRLMFPFPTSSKQRMISISVKGFRLRKIFRSTHRATRSVFVIFFSPQTSHACILTLCNCFTLFSYESNEPTWYRDKKWTFPAFRGHLLRKIFDSKNYSTDFTFVDRKHQMGTFSYKNTIF